MFDLRLASSIMITIAAVAVVMLIGDYAGYKIGRMKLFSITLCTVLGLIIIFAVFAIINSFLIRS